ncbi:hypothetical protein M8C21_013425 [Ambrosia artemisiifolia]|uniref:Ionotropic glutamate receptor C-terminal domain-containing protein n=1 Tax=Ambrosia artemisiifolia TaxID=4212 RepID=A0AAD5CXZ7_AMBAR|nr:hypothetical protein M8C21_013425 [Ambrosia artemisiifolia]
MHYLTTYLIFLVSFCSPLFLDLQALPTNEKLIKVRNEKGTFTRIGVILDQTSRRGKEAKVAIEIAVQDFNNEADHPSVFYLQNSRGKPIHAAIAAKELIEQHNVKVILGAHTWEEASAIAEFISESDKEVPVFHSLAGSTPLQATDQWPFFVQSVPTQSAQMKAVAAILHSWSISQVTLIYETSHLASGSAAIISYLSQAFRETGATLTHILPLSSSLDSLNLELEVLKRQQRKVFVIHTSLELAVHLFQTAKKMNMTGDEYLWIATNAITDLFHSISSTKLSSLKGMIGVKSYFPENTPDYLNFRKRFRQKFRHDYPEEEQDEPGIFAVQGYNAVRLTKPIPATTVEVVYVIGKGYHNVYWTEGLGFSETVEDDTNRETVYTHSMDKLKQVLFPVQPWYASRRGRNLAESSGNRMRNQIVFNGFVIAVFDEMMRELKLPYDYFPFNGSYDELMKQIPAERFDAIAGDVTIMSSRHEYVDFTQPYTESAVTLYNGYIIWLIERTHCEYLRGSFVQQIGIVIWLAFTTLFTLRGDKLHSNLSRMAVVVWLFVALIITQSYTASFASMLTAQRLEPTITSVEVLRNMNATVGYCNGSLVNHYLKDVLGFKSFKVNSYNSTHRYAEALNSGEIAAIFLEVPAAKVFLAQYCKSFIRTGETFKVGGFGFAFPRRFSWLSEANKALMNISERGKIKEYEDAYLISEKCVDDESSHDENGTLNLHSFWVLFVLTGGTSTVSLVIYIITTFREFKKINPERANLFEFIKDHMRRSSSVVVHAETPTHSSSDAADPWTSADINHM